MDSDEIVRELPESCYETIDGLRVISPAKVLALIIDSFAGGGGE